MVAHKKECLGLLIKKIGEKHPEFSSKWKKADDFSDIVNYIYNGKKEAIKTQDVRAKMMRRYEGDAEEDAEGFFDHSEKIRDMTEEFCFTEYH